MDDKIPNTILWLAVVAAALTAIVYYLRQSKRRELQKAGSLLIAQLLREYFQGGKTIGLVSEQARKIAHQHFIGEQGLHALISTVFEATVDAEPITNEKEVLAVNLLTGLQKEFSLPEANVTYALEYLGRKEISQHFEQYARNEVSSSGPYET